MKAYITGICGFAGSWLAEELISRGYRVRGAALPGEPADNLCNLRGEVKIDRFDITKASACRKYIQEARPDFIFHLAAVASVGQSFLMGDLTFRVNLIGTFNLFEAVKNRRWLKKLLLASSADVYGPVKKQDLPLGPGYPFNPVSPYAASKVSAEYLARTYIDQYGLPVVIARSFNHTGPRQSADFVIPSFCQKIVGAERSRVRKPIRVGNLAVKRDISDVRDIVSGYRLLAEKGRIGSAYHLCSGRAYVIGDLLKSLVALSATAIRVEKDEKLYRKSDIPVLRGSYAATRKELGWKPKIKIETTLEDTLSYWRSSR